MPQNLAELRQMLSRVKPWLGVAVILAVVLLGYFLAQGWRYWQASGDVTSLNREILNSENNTRIMVLAGLAASEELEEQPTAGQRTIEELQRLFSHRSAEDLMTIVAATAVEAAVELTAINPGDLQFKVLGELQYQVQPIVVSVAGTQGSTLNGRTPPETLLPSAANIFTADLFRFLTLLHENVPVVSVSGLTISGLGGSPLAQMQLLFYLSPTPIEVEEESG